MGRERQQRQQLRWQRKEESRRPAQSSQLTAHQQPSDTALSPRRRHRGGWKSRRHLSEKRRQGFEAPPGVEEQEQEEMGCSASTVLLEGLRSVLERNCGYVKGPAAAGASRGEEEEDEGGHGGAEPLCNPRGTYPWLPNTAPVTSPTSCMFLRPTAVAPASPCFFLNFPFFIRVPLSF